jgi:hypothetical protein
LKVSVSLVKPISEEFNDVDGSMNIIVERDEFGERRVHNVKDQSSIITMERVQ